MQIMNRLPLGVVIPTRNSMKYLPAHVESLAAWLDLAEQVVVVDSSSQDGSEAFLKEKLQHPNLHFLQHPPGLYASLNHGIRQLNTEFCYLATVGDSLTREGVVQMMSSARSLQCDVLVGTPDFINEAGLPCDGPEWPVAEIANRLQLKQPGCLPAPIVMATALLYLGEALTGSCASDLFRTTVLQRFPFPVTSGKSGDGAWGLQNAGRVRWAATMARVSTFRFHPPASTARELQDGANIYEYARTVTEMVEEWRAGCPAGFPDSIKADIQTMLTLSIEYEKCRGQHNRDRRSRWPWSLNPSAWAVRSRRNSIKQQMEAVRSRIFSDAWLPPG